MSQLTKNRKRPFLSILLSSLVLCIPALYNNFPFIYPDTGTYLMSGFTNHVSALRPATYGIFIRHVSLQDSFWLVIFCQALIVSWLIRKFVLSFFKEMSDWSILLLISFLTATTTIGVTVGMLMPDFSTAILILTTTIILFSNWKRTGSFLFLCFLLWLSIAFHHSHFYILVLMLIFIAGYKMILKKSVDTLTYKRLGLVIGIALFGFVSIPTIHYFKDGQFKSNSATNVFLMGKFNQMGLLEPFLKEQCQHEDYSVCAFKDKLPRDFLWSPESPILIHGNWVNANPEYRKPVRDFLTHPHYLKMFFIKTLETVAQQLVCFNSVEINSLLGDKWLCKRFQLHMPDTVPALEASKQNKKAWTSETINFIQKIIVYSSALFLIYLFFFQERFTIPLVYQNLVFVCFAALVSNATICSGISMIAHRFQSRIIWILPLIAACLGYWIWTTHFGKRPIATP